MSDRAFVIDWHQVLRRQHVIDPWPRLRLKNTLGKYICREALDLFGTLSLGAQFSATFRMRGRNVRVSSASMHCGSWLVG